MFFFFPYTTDAPLYHLPIATLGVILANVLVFLGMATGQIPSPESWILVYGAGLHPQQWLTSIFTHAGVGHLAGNMIFLWVFGLIVEGKIGWWKFLACYLGIGVVHSMLEQLAMLGYTGEVPGALGASAAIFGIMAMAAVWAPLNEITFFYVVWIALVKTGTFEVGVYVMAVCYACWEALMAIIFGGSTGSSILHITGAALGLPLAFAMLKLKLVDCDKNDLLHVWSGDYGNIQIKPYVAKENARLADQSKQRDADRLSAGKFQLRQYLQHGNAAAAATLAIKMKQVGSGLTLDRAELLAVINNLHLAKRWADSAPFMAELIQRFPDGADTVRIKLAQICLVELNRPAKALDLLDAVDLTGVAAPQVALAKKIAAKAREMQAVGEYELDDDAW